MQPSRHSSSCSCISVSGWVALQLARATAAQIKKFDAATRIAAKRFIKPIPYDELRREIDIFCELFSRTAVLDGLRKFVESSNAMPYLP